VLDPTLRTFKVWNNGLNHSSSIWASGAGNFTKKDEVTYVTDSGANPRISQTKSTAWNGTGYNIRTTNIGYTQLDGMWLPTTKDDLLQDGTTVYRRATTSYTSYPSRYLLGLPQTVSVYAGAGTTLLSRSTNNYDETGTYTDSNGQTANYFIDAGGANVTQHDASYNISLTQRGNLTSVVQSSVVNGAVTGTRAVKRLSYDTNGNLRAEADGAANRRQFQYGDYCVNKPGGVGETHLVPYTASDPTGFRTGSQWEYYTGLTIKSFNMLSGGTTELQVVTTSYDFADRPLQVTRPDGGWVKTGYWDNWLAMATSQQVDAGKVRYKFEQMDGAGRGYKKSSDHPDGVSGKFSGQISVFDKVGQVEDSSNVIEINGTWVPAGDDAATGFLFTHLTRDELGRLKIVTFPDNNTKQIDYTGCGCSGNSETRVTDELGHYTITKTDFLGRLIEAIEPSGTTSDGVYSKAVYVYDPLDRLVTINHSKTPTGGQTPTQTRTFGYDGYGRLQSENTPEGGLVTYTYTANDLVWTTTNQRGITVTNSYNTRSLLTQTSYSDGTPTATFGHDAYGARNSMTDGEGATSYSYNNYRQLESETRTFAGLPNNNHTLSYAYSQGDQLKSANYLVTTGGSAGAPFTQTDKSGGSADIYNISGTVRDQQNQPVSGVTITLTGGQSGQMTTGGSGQYSFTNLLTGGNYTLTPSKSGLVFSPSSRTYNNLNSHKTDADFTAIPAQQTIFNKNVNYDYNSVGALAGVGTNLIGSDPNATTNVLNTVSFRAPGALKTLHYGNGRRLQMGYYAQRGQPASMKVDRVSNPSDKIIDYAYEYYDANGKNNNRIRQITDNVDGNYTTTYLYDDYDRLTHATSTAFSAYNQYDEWNNIRNLNGLTLNYATNASGAPATNRISTDSQSYSYTWDAAGNMTGGPGQALDYDGANRLKTASGGSSTYGYDGNGMRVRVTENGTAVFYVHSTALGQNAMEVTSVGVQRAYVYDGGRMVAMQAPDGQFYWLHTNHLGSARAMTDISGNLIYRGRFAPYGEAISEWSSSGNTNLNKKKFTGYERDVATGLDYASARMYSPSRGRFAQPDPIGLKAAKMELPLSLNRYSYVGNDPINSVDPSGLLTIIIGGFLNGQATWGQPDTDMWKAIRDTFGEDPRVFEWAALAVFYPLYSDIQLAGVELAKFLNGYDFKEGEKLNIVAHSHGGNVVKVASQNLRQSTRSIDNLVTLGTAQNYDLPLINTFKVKNHCNVSSLVDPVQFGGSSPTQIFRTVENTRDGAYHASWAAYELFRGNFSKAAWHSALSAQYFALAAAWVLSTRIDPLANKNVLFGSEGHSELHTVPVWNKINGECGL
jgi:RHS repeat-associated protein